MGCRGTTRRYPGRCGGCGPSRGGGLLLWDEMQTVYDAGEYAAAADIGRELTEAQCDQRDFYDNTACRESLAGRRPDAVRHTRQAIDMWEGCRGVAKDSDFDPIRQSALLPARSREFERT